MGDELLKRLDAGAWPQAANMQEAAAEIRQQQQEIKRLCAALNTLEAELAAKVCPLGDECDLTGAYMAGAEKAKDTIRQQQQTIDRLRIALADAIRRPMGVVPDSAAELAAQNKRLKSESEKIKMMAARAFYEGMKSTARTTLASIRSEGSD